MSLHLSSSSTDNAELYGKVGVPFVMGTTGGDTDLLYKTVEDSKVYAVISPQMGKQVIANIFIGSNTITTLGVSLPYLNTLSCMTRLLHFFRPWNTWRRNFLELSLVIQCR